MHDIVMIQFPGNIDVGLALAAYEASSEVNQFFPPSMIIIFREKQN